MEIVLTLLLGFFGGLFAGFLGVGGGLFFVPIFAVILEKRAIPEEHLATAIIAHSVCLTLLSSLTGSIKQFLQKNFFIKEVLAVGVPGLITTALFSNYLSNAEWFNKKTFSILFALIIIFVIIKMLLPNKKIHTSQITNPPLYKYSFIGVLGALVAAISGLGGGIIMVPLLTFWLNRNIKEAGSISLGVIVLLSASIVLFYSFVPKTMEWGLDFQQGKIAYSLVLLIAPGVVVGAPIGVALSKKVNPRIIKIAFLIAACLVLVKMILL